MYLRVYLCTEMYAFSFPARKDLSSGMMCILPGHIPSAFAFMCVPGYGLHLQLMRKYLST